MSVRLFVSTLALVCGASAHAQPCQIERGSDGLEFGCLPAVSADGQTLAVPEVAADGARGLPNLDVRFMKVTAGHAGEVLHVLSIAEIARAQGQLSDRLWASAVQKRVVELNQRLKTGGFHSLTKVGVPKAEREAPNQKVPLYAEGVDVVHEGKTLDVVRTGTVIDHYEIDSPKGCAQPGYSYVDELRLGDSLLAVRMAQHGSKESNCSPSAGGWHIVQLKTDLKK